MLAKPHHKLMLFMAVTTAFGVLGVTLGLRGGNYVLLAAGILALGGSVTLAVAMVSRRTS
ncbi:hypothetical protein [Streptomyces sp. NPDC047071]|uniref:hypothetical protein n=1 Tax=Streptomyces sp. NPDC047071 TaxID=3154808 RepID=UPI003451DCD5